MNLCFFTVNIADQNWGEIVINKLKQRGASVLALSAALAATVLTAVPADAAATVPVDTTAATSCTGWQHKEFSTSGFDTDVDIKLCVKKIYYDGAELHEASGKIKWTDGGGLQKFDNFDLHVRLERKNVNYNKDFCDFTNSIDFDSSGSDSCFAGNSGSSRNGGWTADGYVAYDYDADGKGGYAWKLHGSSAIN